MKIHKQLLLLILFILSGSYKASSQDLCGEIPFIKHMMSIEEYKDALYLLNQADSMKACENTVSKNEITYLKGKNLYYLKKLNPSARTFLQVKKSSKHYHESRFYAAYQLVHLEKHEEGRRILQNLDVQDNQQEQLKNYQLAGIALLNRQTRLYQQNNEYLHDYYPIEEGKEKFYDYYQKIKTHKTKSPLLAGVFSAVIPGLGKIYAGKTGEGISAFLTTGVLGAMTAKSYLKKGIKSPRTLIFGTLFGIYYTGNIWGSVFAVQIAENEYNESINKNILFHLHVPLRTVFE